MSFFDYPRIIDPNGTIRHSVARYNSLGQMMTYFGETSIADFHEFWVSLTLEERAELRYMEM